MKTIYIDSDYICHVTNDGTMREIQTEAFGGSNETNSSYTFQENRIYTYSK